MNRTLRLAALMALAVTPAAWADGLYLKLNAAETNATGVTVTLKAVSTYNFRLPESPVFLVDDGNGMKPAGVQVRALGPAESVKVTPEAPYTGSWQLPLAPGSYKLKVRYKLADRTVESNAVKVEIPGPAQASR
jgi:hypothetical protein